MAAKIKPKPLFELQCYSTCEGDHVLGVLPRLSGRAALVGRGGLRRTQHAVALLLVLFHGNPVQQLLHDRHELVEGDDTIVILVRKLGDLSDLCPCEAEVERLALQYLCMARRRAGKVGGGLRRT